MDINLPDMLGSEAAKMMREFEKIYSNKRTNIIAVSVEGKKNVLVDDTFDDYCKMIKLYFLVEKPIKNKDFTDYISKHFQKNRQEIKSNIIRNSPQIK